MSDAATLEGYDLIASGKVREIDEQAASKRTATQRMMRILEEWRWREMIPRREAMGNENHQLKCQASVEA